MIHLRPRPHLARWTRWQPTWDVRVCPDGTEVTLEAHHCRTCGQWRSRPATVVSGPALDPGSLDAGKWRRS